MEASTDVTNNTSENRFEAQTGAGLAVVEYVREDSRIAFTHTLVPEEAEGQGVGSRLARAALDFARDERLSVIPLCPFVAAYVRKHPEYLALVDPAYAGRLAD